MFQKEDDMTASPTHNAPPGGGEQSIFDYSSKVTQVEQAVTIYPYPYV